MRREGSRLLYGDCTYNIDFYHNLLTVNSVIAIVGYAA